MTLDQCQIHKQDTFAVLVFNLIGMGGSRLMTKAICNRCLSLETLEGIAAELRAVLEHEGRCPITGHHDQ